MKQLFIVPTPIGNLEDMTYRAVSVLNKVDFILAEDTRVSGKLLKHYNISTPMLAHHQHNEHKYTNSLVDRMQNGETFALISDAGTPGISDPGYLLVRACYQNNLEVSCLPGATALIPAIVQSGIPSDRFVFEGFLPVKKGRQKKLATLAQEDRTIVLYESPYRILKTLNDLAMHLGENRIVSLSREISKKFEATFTDQIKTAVAFYTENQPKGEFVIVIEGKSSKLNLGNT
ncbi:MAG: 16S rRNA (cytidine(1402)-2'-O)-methyltransferase [Psychroflexus sp.]|jgi:16S rRNA (cytidine1402-2'-O)-methyltransferase|nr:16S rRNA (cytidine(1402)-2'-O)-methyltransferase [Psychroflexus sp.]MDR9447911.1 16S rRNA (cytidine(1402)-2'-O)-methyltransferase [Psychroflexus sp.]